MRSRLLPFAAAALMAACGSSPTAPVEPAGGAPAVRGTGTATAANLPPKGELRTTPDAGSDGVLLSEAGDRVRVNAAHMRDPENEPLLLGVAWGDGATGTAACGICRLEHAYAVGSYTLTATVSDGTNVVTRTFLVIVSTACVVLDSASGTGSAVTIGPQLGVAAGDRVIAEIRHRGANVDTRISFNGGPFRYASVVLNGGAFFPNQVSFKVFAGIGGQVRADFASLSPGSYDWSLSVAKCQRSALLPMDATFEPPGSATPAPW